MERRAGQFGHGKERRLEAFEMRCNTQSLSDKRTEGRGSVKLRTVNQTSLCLSVTSRKGRLMGFVLSMPAGGG